MVTLVTLVTMVTTLVTMETTLAMETGKIVLNKKEQKLFFNFKSIVIVEQK